MSVSHIFYPPLPFSTWGSCTLCSSTARTDPTPSIGHALGHHDDDVTLVGPPAEVIAAFEWAIKAIPETTGLSSAHLEEFINTLQGASCPFRGGPISSMTRAYDNIIRD
jgi:hypothetical protein